MKMLSRFNPAKSLFLLVFLWFWLATLLIVFSSIWLAKQLSSEAQYLPLNMQQQTDLVTLTHRLQKKIDKRSGHVDLKKMLVQMRRENRRRNRFDFILVDPLTRNIMHNEIRSRLISNEIFERYDQRSSPLMLELRGVTFIGPGQIRANQTDYMLFLVEPRPPGSFRFVWHEYPGVFVALMLSLSLGLCYLFVGGLLSPITQLRQASKRMAAGEMGVRVGRASQRLDEIGQLGRDFNYMSEQVESLLTSQKRLMADISHELRSPLTRLQLSIGIALQQSKFEMSGNMLSALERIEKEALQIEDMIAQVLLLSKLDNQQPIQTLQSVSLEQIMAPIIADAQFEAEQKHKELSYQADENISVYADPQLLSSAIENILRNAIHYSNHVIQVSVSAQDKYIVWVIEDDGDGIEEELLDRVFEAFYRQSSARDRNSGGVGLGLAIAQRAVDKHQGHIQASNKPQGGLRVQVSIPVLGA